MFDNITGYRSGQRVLSASIANARRLGVTLDSEQISTTVR